MSIYINVGGSRKQLQSIRTNKDGSNKILSTLYGRIQGSNKNLLETTYIWYKYVPNSWKDTAGTNTTFTHTDTDYRECGICGGHHYYTSGYLSLSNGDKLYSSYGFDSSTGLYYGTGSVKIYSTSDPDGGYYYYCSSGYHCLYKVGYYHDLGTNEHGWSNGSGCEISSYRFATPLVDYKSSPYTILTSTNQYAYSAGGGQHHRCHSSDPNDGANNDEMEYYDGYLIEYKGKF